MHQAFFLRRVMGGKICMRHGGKNWEIFCKNWVVLFDLFDLVDIFPKKNSLCISQQNVIGRFTHPSRMVSLFHDTKRPQIPKAHHIGLQRWLLHHDSPKPCESSIFVMWCYCLWLEETSRMMKRKKGTFLPWPIIHHNNVAVAPCKFEIPLNLADRKKNAERWKEAYYYHITTIRLRLLPHQCTTLFIRA